MIRVLTTQSRQKDSYVYMHLWKIKDFVLVQYSFSLISLKLYSVLKAIIITV